MLPVSGRREPYPQLAERKTVAGRAFSPRQRQQRHAGGDRKGAANPSIAILCKLAAALGVSVADIVNVSSEPQIHIIQEEAIPVLWQGAQGGYARLLAGTAGGYD